MTSGLINKLSSFLPEERYSTHRSHLETASRDESSFPAVLPSVVVWPNSTDEISQIVKLAIEFKLPITARGSGSALEGSAIPAESGIVLDLSRMNKIKNYWPDDLQVEVEPGIIFDDLNNEIKRDGLFFPPSPGGSGHLATIGGMVSTNASGIFSVKYGGTKNYVLKLEIVTGAGEIIKLGSRATKRSSGYNLVDLIVGSEGTLGVISSITLSLSGLPEHTLQNSFTFDNQISAAKAVSEIRKFGIDIAAIEFLDSPVIESVNKLKDYKLTVSPYLFLEFHGNNESTKSEAESARVICLENNGREIFLAENQNPWEIRHFVTESIKHFSPGKKIIRNDIAFPISKLPEAVQFCTQLSSEYKIPVFCFGHVGMGLLHALILANPDDEREWKEGNEINSRIIRKSVELEGTVSGEHGIGLGHKSHFLIEHGKSVDYMKKIKKEFDPHNILNPGKIFDL